MKRKSTLVIILIAFIALTKAQDFGRVLIRNSNDNYPGFIISLNGVRLTNDYNSKVKFDYLDEKHYKVKLLQEGSSRVLTFMLTCEPNYDCKYLVNKDSYGNYTLILESKSLMKDGKGGSHRDRDKKEVEIVQDEREIIVSEPVLKPMPDAEYDQIIKSLKKESFENTKLDMAKTFFGKEPLTSVQVLGVLKIFSFENTKVDFAKFMYPKTYDKNNFFKVYDAFMMSRSKDEISKYIKENP
jgi:hypothetical protein